MGKLSRTKKNKMFNEYCYHSECGRYMEFLEKRVSELEFELRMEKMKKGDLDSLIEEIENMSVEEYNKYHEEAKKMKKAYDEMIKAMEAKSGERNKRF